MKITTILLLFFNLLSLPAVQNCLDFYYDQVHVDHDASLNMGTGGFTIEAWIKTSANVPENDWPVIVGKENWSPRQGFNLFIAHHTNKIAFEVWVDGNWYGIWGQVINDGKWHHVVGKRNGDYVSSYKDGVGSTWHRPGANGNVNTDYPLVIGDASWGNNNNFDGMIEEVRVWNRSLSNEEIQEMMFKELEGTETNLQGYYQFNETSGSFVPDLTANNNDGTNSGADWTASYAPIASVLLDSLSNIRGVWNAKTSHTSSILTISDPDISGNNRIVFGHNADSLVFNSTNVPDGIENRLARVWRIEEYSNLNGDLIFDCTDLESRNENYRLLIDADGEFSDAAIYFGSWESPQFSITDHEFEHSYYYTLGIAQEILPAPENIVVSIENDSVIVSWDESTGATSYKVYSDTNPYGTFSTNEWIGTDTTWSEAILLDKKFYYISAVN